MKRRLTKEERSILQALSGGMMLTEGLDEEKRKIVEELEKEGLVEKIEYITATQKGKEIFRH